MIRVILSLLLLAAVGLSCSCGKPSKSKRDVTRDELRNTAETKRKELLPVVGRYQGTLQLPESRVQGISLNLAIRDVPTTVEGQVDPVMTPVLGGDFRFDFGHGNVVAEYVTFTIEKGDYEPKSNKLSLICSSTTYKNLTLQLVRGEKQLDGTWAIEKFGSGAVKLQRSGEALDNLFSEPLTGTYRGRLINTISLPEDVDINFVTSQDPSQPEGLKISGNLRIYYDGFGGTEWQDWSFESIEPNYFLRTVNIKTKKNGLTLKLKLNGKKLTGAVESDTLSNIGTVEVEKL